MEMFLRLIQKTFSITGAEKIIAPKSILIFGRPGGCSVIALIPRAVWRLPVRGAPSSPPPGTPHQPRQQAAATAPPAAMHTIKT
ncbi:hypothetical protein DMA11_16030 [Marinilabiliaceae bacterium JC017]|nr:hypothetical protein DMA11_16030 [Marinilabiliaceae bacterium JC017]